MMDLRIQLDDLQTIIAKIVKEVFVIGLIQFTGNLYWLVRV